MGWFCMALDIGGDDAGVVEELRTGARGEGVPLSDGCSLRPFCFILELAESGDCSSRTKPGFHWARSMFSVDGRLFRREREGGRGLPFVVIVAVASIDGMIQSMYQSG